ncbi:MAG: ATP-binding protein [bacterium]|nr:ATP-binding protein [bacterium]
MTAVATLPMYFKKDDDAPKKRRKRKTLAHHVRTIKNASSNIRERVNQELYKRNAELAVRNKTLALLRTLDEIALSAEKVEDMAQQIVDAISKELSFEVTAISIVDELHMMRYCAGVGSSNERLAESLKKICRTLPALALMDAPDTQHAMETGEKTYSNDLRRVYAKEIVDVIKKTQKETKIAASTHSMILPLRFGNETLGLLSLSTSRSFMNASGYEYEALSGIVSLIALAIYKAKLYQDLQRTSAELTDANMQLTNLDKAKSEFLSIASHQLYTPLTALRGYISMLREGDYGVVVKEQAPILDILDKSATRLIELIKSLLDISRIESGRFELNLESVDLAEMARVLVADLLPNAINKKLELTFHEPKAPLAHAVVDVQRIRQVMLNFVDNSIKYTPAGKVDVFIVQEGEKITFSVSDTGNGLETNDISQLFHKFIRVGGAARFHTEGTGLGLYVAKQIVNEHHGEVTAFSEGLKKGSTFSVVLPIEGSASSLKVGEKASVVIKAANAQ